MKSLMQTNPLSFSPMKSASALKKEGQARMKKTIGSSLMLTSLVDAFSILVIYLLMSASANTETLDVSKTMQLPMATQTEMLERGPVIKIENKQYFIEDRPIHVDSLPRELANLRARIEAETPEADRAKAKKLIIQADKRADFGMINPILLSASQTGFNQFRFAVLQTAVAEK